jgi:hypothetical protein
VKARTALEVLLWPRPRYTEIDLLPNKDTIKYFWEKAGKKWPKREPSRRVLNERYDTLREIAFDRIGRALDSEERIINAINDLKTEIKATRVVYVGSSDSNP